MKDLVPKLSEPSEFRIATVETTGFSLVVFREHVAELGLDSGGCKCDHGNPGTRAECDANVDFQQQGATANGAPVLVERVLIEGQGEPVLSL